MDTQGEHSSPRSEPKANEVNATERSRIAYVVSRYPAVSHTFIRREVEALRAQGVDVQTYSVHAPVTHELLTDADRIEHARTRSLLPATPQRVALALLGALLRAPLRFASALALVFVIRPPGLRSWLYGLFYLAEAALLFRDARTRGIAHVHAHFANAGGEVALLASRLLGVGWSVTLHGLSDFGDPKRGRLRQKIAAARFVVCISEFGSRSARAVSPGALHARIQVVRCGLDADELASALAPGSSGPRVRLLNVGRLAPEKAQALLLRALARALANGVDAELAIVGEGPERAALEREIAQLQLGGRVSLLGAKAGAELSAEYARADVFALSSLAEGLPVVLMEAYARGLACIAPAISGIPELVRENQSGWLFPVGDVEALASAIERAARDASLRQSFGLAGRDVVRELHDVRKNAAALARLFDEAASG